MLEAFVYNNTIYGTATGISFSAAPSGASLVAGNAVFAGTPLSGTMPNETDNVKETSLAGADAYFVSPSITVGQMNFFPKTGSALKGSVIDLSQVAGDVDYDRDFNGSSKDFTYRGAYHGEGQNPGWALADDLKPLTGAAGTAGGGTGGTGTGAAAGTGGSGAAAAAAVAAPQVQVLAVLMKTAAGCGCRTAGDSPASGWALVVLLAALGWRRRR